MKALAILVAGCAVFTFATPSSAFVRAVGPGLAHGGQLHGIGRHDHRGSGLWVDGVLGGDAYPAPAADDTANAPNEPIVDLPPPLLCPGFEPRPRPSGPRIIYIGHQPAAPHNLPKVIYGTQ